MSLCAWCRLSVFHDRVRLFALTLRLGVASARLSLLPPAPRPDFSDVLHQQDQHFPRPLFGFNKDAGIEELRGKLLRYDRDAEFEGLYAKVRNIEEAVVAARAARRPIGFTAAPGYAVQAVEDAWVAWGRALTHLVAISALLDQLRHVIGREGNAWWRPWRSECLYCLCGKAAKQEYCYPV